MISLAVLTALLAVAQSEAEAPMMTITEPRAAERLRASFEGRCDGRTLELGGAGAGLPASDAPSLTLDGKPVALPAAATAFRSADR